MASEKPRALIITGYGLNCEAESAHAWRLAGAEPALMHLQDLCDAPASMADFQILMFIGGFSFGDHMGAGHVLALRIRHRLREALQRFIDSGGLILGVCNGFQTMARLGLVPALEGDYFAPAVALTANDCGVFQNFWVRLRFEKKSPCIFTRGLPDMDLPIRHGEGKVFVPPKKTLAELEARGCAACRYIEKRTGRPALRFPDNPNGSVNAIAGICDPTGRVFGLMPHPEAYLFPENHPHWEFQRQEGALPKRGLGLEIFRNALLHLR